MLTAHVDTDCCADPNWAADSSLGTADLDPSYKVMNFD